jgi:hypothetical protein
VYLPRALEVVKMAYARLKTSSAYSVSDQDVPARGWEDLPSLESAYLAQEQADMPSPDLVYPTQGLEDLSAPDLAFQA